MMKNTTINTTINTVIETSIKAFEEWAVANDLDEYEVKMELKRVFPGVEFQGINYGLYTRNGYRRNYCVVAIRGGVYTVHFYEYSEYYDQYSEEYMYR